MLQEIAQWHLVARPAPTADDLRVQIGCHLEEVAEFLDSLCGLSSDAAIALDGARHLMRTLAERVKTAEYDVTIHKRLDALDALCDQVVTAIGIGHCAGFRTIDALRAVNSSNWSKFVDGQPLRDANGKIIKGPDYRSPELEQFVK